jgi:hypothetical protein
MTDFVNQTYQKLLKAIDRLPMLRNLGVKSPVLVADCVTEAVGVLRDHFAGRPFAGPDEEVNFFKYQKPLFLAERFYAVELYELESHKPAGGEGVWRDYYEQELRLVRRRFERNRFLYQYYQLDGCEFDRSLFVLNAFTDLFWLPRGLELDRGFTTEASNLFAEFMAAERLQDYLLGRLYDGHGTGLGSGLERMRWSGDKTNLVELGYALYYSLQVNDGDITVTDIFNLLGFIFQVNLERHHQVYSEIRMRKNVSKTRFIDHMRSVLQHAIEEGDAYRPQKPRQVSGSRR